MNIARYRKFVVALAAALGVLLTTMADSSLGGNAVVASEWITIVLAFMGALGVYQVPNDK